jgi:hypothetical protein
MSIENNVQNTFIHFDTTEKPDTFSIRRVKSSPALTFFGQVEKPVLEQKRHSLPARLDIAMIAQNMPMMSPNRLMVSPVLSHQSSGVSTYSAVSPYSQMSYSNSMCSREDNKRGSLASLSTACSDVNEEFQKPDRLSRFAKQKATEHKTTVMIRNIPCKCTQEHLVQEVSQYTSAFNFLYLPMSRLRDGTLGYAFVNFLTAEEATQFMDAFTGHKFRRLPHSRKRTEVTFAVLQGFRENVRFYRRSKVTKTEYGPYINREARSEVSP